MPIETVHENVNSSLAQESNKITDSTVHVTPGMPEACRRAAAESMVLLKNDGVLPLRPTDTVAVFGRCQCDTFYVGYGSGGDVCPPYKVSYIAGLAEAAAAGRIRLDDDLRRLYADWSARSENRPNEGTWGNWPMHYPEMPVSSDLAMAHAETADVAVVILGRAAGEDRENTLEKGSYYLTDGECTLLDAVTAAFRKTAVVLDCGNIIDMAWVSAYGDKISAVLYAWQGGMESGHALADVLTGAVNPSGKLPDTIAGTYEDQPTAKNFGAAAYNNYAEDIFVGYRYFETFAPERVLYPFGFGLSYTTFSVKPVSFSYDGGLVTATVTVTNTGVCAGREVVQMYAKAPQGKLGKAARTLAAFAKTASLRPGESERVTLTAGEDDFASYDDSGITGHKHAFLLEAGTYTFFVGRDVRATCVAGGFQLVADKVLRTLQGVCGAEHPFDRLHAEEKDGRIVPTAEPVPLKDYDLRERILAHLPADVGAPTSNGYRFPDVTAGRVSLDDFISDLTDEELEALTRGEGSLNSSLGTPGNAGVFGGILPALRERGVPPVVTNDGPAGIRVAYHTALLPCGTALAATWDTALVKDLYTLVGKEMTYYGTDIMLGAGMNIHRNPLCGRNFEYFSEDPYLTGKMATAFVLGVQSTGRGACPKHFACNNQETCRNTNDSRVSERALREIYLRGFEICIGEGHPAAVMTSYNKINGVWSHYNYDLCTTVLRGEWGFEGMVMTDWWMQKSKSPEFPDIEDNAYRVRAQVDLLMPGNVVKFAPDYVSDGTLLPTLGRPGGLTRAELHRSVKNVLCCALRLKK